MSRKDVIVCDRCGKEIVVFNNVQIREETARIDLYPVRASRTYPTQRIDLCAKCYQEFINYLENGND